MIAIRADMSASSATDMVSLRIVDNTDRTILSDIAGALAAQLHATAPDLTFKTGDPRFIKDRGIGVEFRAPVVPRGESYLPVAPFITACARYAGRLRILYIIQGAFTYHGFQQYQQPDVSFTVDKPEQITVPEPLAFYGMNVIINNPTPGAAQIPNYPVEAIAAARKHAVDVRVFLLAIAGIIGLALGLLLVALLLRWKEEDARLHKHRNQPQLDKETNAQDIQDGI